MIVQIIDTTDGKYIGLKIDVDKQIVFPDGVIFTPSIKQDLSGGILRYSNSNYTIVIKKIKDKR